MAPHAGTRTAWRAARQAVLAIAAIGILLLVSALPAQAQIEDKHNDYNRDRISDIIGININNNCLVRWSGNGSGGVGSGVTLGTCTWGAYTGSLAAPGDLNRDGVGDLVAIHGGTGCLVRWLGNGSGGIGNGTQLGCGWSAYADTLAGAGDLNNDGNGDLVGINGDVYSLYFGDLFRWFGNGSGGFGPGVAIDRSGSFQTYTNLTGAGDLNSDGFADLVGTELGGCLVRWDGDGAGGIAGGYQIGGGCTWDDYDLSGMGDFNRDSYGDLVGINVRNGCLVRWLGNGNGGVLSGVTIGTCTWSYNLAR